MFGVLPSQLPDDVSTVCLDYETSGLYPDSGAYIASAGVSWRGRDGSIVAHAWPFAQGLYGKPEIETARFGWHEERVINGYYKNDSQTTGAKAGDPKWKKNRRKLTAAEVLSPNPNIDVAEWEALTRWLLQRDIVAHNAMFEVIMSDAGVPGGSSVDLLDNVVWCTFLGNHILDPEHEKGIKPTAQRLYGEDPDERDRLKEHLKARGVPAARYDLADWEVLEPYLLQDIRLGLKLARHQFLRFRGHEARRERLDDALDEMAVLVKMERRGLPYQAAESLRWAEKIEAAADELETKLPFRPTTPEATKFYFTTEINDKDTHCLGLKPIKLTDSKNPSLDAEVLETLAATDKPHARTFYQLRQLREASGRYYRGYAEAVGTDGRLRTRFRQIGTKPGRISCERTNLMAIPHDHRMLAAGAPVLTEAPSPRDLIDLQIPGFEGWHMDLMQAELRVASEYANAASMLELVESGKDAHGETAIALGLATGPEDPGWYKARSVIAKRFNFSLIFGVGHVKAREDLRKISGLDLESPDHLCTSGKNGCTPNRCKVKRLHVDWNRLYPEFKSAIDVHMRLAEREHKTWVRDDIYRHYTKVEIAYREFHKAFNNRVQGNIGYFTKRWMVLAERWLAKYDLPPGSGLLLQIHDALLLMLPVGMKWLAEEVAQLGRDLWTEWFTVSGGVEVEPWNKNRGQTK